MYAVVAWVLVSSGTKAQPQVILDPDYLPDYLSVCYDYETNLLLILKLIISVKDPFGMTFIWYTIEFTKFLHHKMRILTFQIAKDDLHFCNLIWAEHYNLYVQNLHIFQWFDNDSYFKISVKKSIINLTDLFEY